MQVSGMTGLSASTLANNLSAPTSDSSGDFQKLVNTGDPSDSSDPVQTFLNYMKETPAQQLEDAWLAGHHLTHKDLEKMSPEERAKIEKEMAADIKEKLKEQTEKKSGTTVDLQA